MHIIHNIHNVHNIYSIHNIMRGVETLGSDLYDQKMKPPGRFYLGVPGFIWFRLSRSAPSRPNALYNNSTHVIAKISITNHDIIQTR